MKKIIWEILDNRPGNNRQIQAISSIIQDFIDKDINIITKNITHNKLAKLPNFILLKNFATISKENINILINQTPPDIIITAGRRNARIAVELKKYYPNAKLIQIMWPNFLSSKFDLIILPSHDQYKPKKNILKIDGSISYFPTNLLEEEKKIWAKEFSQFKNPIITLLFGGNSKNCQINDHDIKKLLQFANELTISRNGFLIIVTSRRTDYNHIHLIKNNINSRYYLYNFHEDKSNPYLATLLFSDEIIVTLDSVSMCTEACNLGKKILIFEPSTCSQKLQKFARILIDNNYAYKIEEYNLGLRYAQRKLDFTNIISNKIKEMIFS